MMVRPWSTTHLRLRSTRNLILKRVLSHIGRLIRYFLIALLNPSLLLLAHRCVFLLFKQPDGFKDQKEVTPDSPRPSFNVSGFAQKVGLGDPVAGNFVLVAPQN